MRILLLILALVLSTSPAPATNAADTAPLTKDSKNYQFINGQWFDGKSFRRQTLYSVDGVFTHSRPAKVDEVLNLHDGFVVPPFADAHTHSYDAPFAIAQQVGLALHDGVFYAKVQTDVRSRALLVADKVNIPTSVDVSYAHGALTASYGHGIEVYEGLALFPRSRSYTPEQIQQIRESRLRDNDAYYIIDTAQDLEEKWPRIVAGQPDFIKIYLLNSEEYETRKDRFDTVGDRGLNPALVPDIVRKAHAAGLRVSAHVDSANDYRVALRGGVDEMAHMPGYYIPANSNPDAFLLTDEDAKETARRGVWVVPCPLAGPLADSNNPAFDAERKKRTDAAIVHNLKLLKKNSVKIAIGSDRYGLTPVDDILYLHELGVFDNRELLKMWTEDTPHMIFPKRKIGLLRDGYEASFVVLDANPLTDFSQIKNIRVRFKQGNLLGS